MTELVCTQMNAVSVGATALLAVQIWLHATTMQLRPAITIHVSTPDVMTAQRAIMTMELDVMMVLACTKMNAATAAEWPTQGARIQ